MNAFLLILLVIKYMSMMPLGKCAPMQLSGNYEQISSIKNFLEMTANTFLAAYTEQRYHIIVEISFRY